MERDRVGTRTAWPQVLAVALALAATAAWGAGQTSSFRVGLRIAASCRIDSAAVFQAAAATVPRPAVSCDFGTPGAVRVTHEPLPSPQVARGSRDGSTRVVTLTF